MSSVARRRVSVFVFAVFGLVASGCGSASKDGGDPTGPDNTPHHALITVSASLSTSSTAANTPPILHAAGLDVDRVHAVITTASGSILKDTTIAVTLAQLPLSLTIDLPVDPGSLIRANATLLSGVVAVFAGTTQLTAYAAGTPAGSIPAGSISAESIAPGSAAARVTLTAIDPSPLGAPVTLSAKALLADNTEIANAIFQWTVDDATIATVGPTGILTPTTKAGTVHVTATTLSGSSASATVVFFAPATKVVVVSGGGQTATVGWPLPAPFVVEAQSADGVPVPNQTVTFGAANGSSVATATVKTGSDGRAQTAVTLGQAARTYGFSATANGASASISATATPDWPAASSVVSGNGQSDTVQKALKTPFVVKVVDQYGNVTPGVTVNWVRAAGTGAVGAASSTTDVNGLASMTYTLGASPGAETITARAANLQTISTFGAVAVPRTAGVGPIFWTNPSGGNWSNPANWSLQRLPVTGDSVVIATPGTYTVVLDTTFTASKMVVGDGGASHPTVSLTSRTLTIDTDLTVKDGAKIVTTGGAGVIAGAGTVNNGGAIDLSDGDLTVSPVLTNAGTITVPGSRTLTTNGQLTLAGSLVGGGALVSNNGGALTLGGTIAMSSMTFNNAQVTQHSTIGSGVTMDVAFNGCTVVGGGSLTIESASHLTMKNSSIAISGFVGRGRMDFIGANALSVGFVNSATAAVVVANDGTTAGILTVGDLQLNGSLALQGSGGVEVSLVANSLTITSSGSLTASGDGGATRRIVSAGVMNNGRITVAADGPGSLLITGNYTSSSSSNLDLHVGPGLAKGALTVGGVARFSGHINVASQGGTPAANSQYALLTYGASSAFILETFALPDGLASWTQDVGATAYSITRK